MWSQKVHTRTCVCVCDLDSHCQAAFMLPVNLEEGIGEWVWEEEEAATEVILGVCNLLPQEVGHALPGLRLPLEVPLDILEVCHSPHQSLCGSGTPPSLPLPVMLSLWMYLKHQSRISLFLYVVCVRMCACLCEDHCETFGVISFFA